MPAVQIGPMDRVPGLGKGPLVPTKEEEVDMSVFDLTDLFQVVYDAFHQKKPLKPPPAPQGGPGGYPMYRSSKMPTSETAYRMLEAYARDKGYAITERPYSEMMSHRKTIGWETGHEIEIAAKLPYSLALDVLSHEVTAKDLKMEHYLRTGVPVDHAAIEGEITAKGRGLVNELMVRAALQSD